MKYPRSWKGFLRCEEKVRYYWDGELIGEVRSRRAPGAATPGGMVTHKEWDATLPGEREPHGGYGLESQTLAIDYLIGVHFSRKPGAREAWLAHHRTERKEGFIMSDCHWCGEPIAEGAELVREKDRELPGPSSELPWRLYHVRCYDELRQAEDERQEDEEHDRGELERMRREAAEEERWEEERERMRS